MLFVLLALYIALVLLAGPRRLERRARHGTKRH